MDFLKRVFSPIILVISLFLLFYTFYQSEIYWSGEKRNYYATYYFIAFILIFFSVISFFLSQEIKEYIIIFGITLIISLYLFESILIFKKNFSKKINLEQLPKKKLYEEATGKRWDNRTKEEIYQDKNNIKETVLVVSPSNYLNKDYPIFPLSGISNAETIYCNENGYFSIYQSDRFGFSNPDEEWDKKEIEYLILGDSFAHGACVNRPNDIASVLRNLSKKTVLNLGFGGNGPLTEYASLREYYNKNIKIKKILWLYFEGNDFDDLSKELNNKFLNSYLNDLKFTQNLKFKQEEINSVAKNLIEEIEIKKTLKSEDLDDINVENKKNILISKNKDLKNYVSQIIKFIKINNLRFLISPPQGIPPPPEFKKILKLAKNFASENKSEIYFVYLPSYNRYNSRFNKDRYDYVKNVIDDLNIPIIDIHKKVFNKEKNPLKLFPLVYPVHYNIYGYKKTAQAIYQFSK